MPEIILAQHTAAPHDAHAVDTHTGDAHATDAHAADTHTGETHGATAIETAHDDVLHVEHDPHAAVAHEAHTTSAGHHGLELGRHLTHPPEPPHIIELWYKTEQHHLIDEYVAAHPGSEVPTVVEKWLVKNEQTGEWEAIDGESPTSAQLLHYGSLTKPLPLVGYAPWENHAYFVLAAIVLVGGFFLLTSSFRRNRNSAMRAPSRGHMFIELIVGGFDQFCKGILGEKPGRQYMPFIGTLFCIILVSNLMGLVPLLKAPTSYVLITFSLALCTFIITQGTAWLRLGPVSYVYHLLGQPKDAFGWFLGIFLFLPLEIISDFFAKPLSLCLRLFGNILGKDILLGAFVGMGVGLVGLISPALANFFGIPLTIPFLFLGLLLSTIQALVFALLSAIYISLVLPHDHDHDDHHEEHLEHVEDIVSEAVPS